MPPQQNVAPPSKTIVSGKKNVSWTTTPLPRPGQRGPKGPERRRIAPLPRPGVAAASLLPLARFSACAFNAKRKQLCHWRIRTTTTTATATAVPTGRAAPHSFAWLRLPTGQEVPPATAFPSARHLGTCQRRAPLRPPHLEQPADAHGAMGRKRLITDSFQVVKKKKRESKEVKAQSPPCDAEIVQSKTLLQEPVQPDQVEELKQFDLSWEFGPCTGITRLQRWERAELLGLSPPTTVRKLLLKHKGNPTIVHSLWHEYSL